jgi:hypothetical protein
LHHNHGWQWEKYQVLTCSLAPWTGPQGNSAEPLHTSLAQQLNHCLCLQCWKMDERNATSAEINQFVTLWTLIRHINFTDQEDGIEWRFKANGQYSTKLAYTIQFAGSFGEHEWNKMWRAKLENKCKFFSWLLLQNKLWTADRLIKHGAIANPIYQLCHAYPESVIHMMAQCLYSRLVWTTLSSWLGTDLQPPSTRNYRRFKSWWHAMTVAGGHGNEAVRVRMQKLIYTVWNI